PETGGQSPTQEAGIRRRSQEPRATRNTHSVCADKTSLHHRRGEQSALDWFEREFVPLFNRSERGRDHRAAARRWVAEHNPDPRMRARILACKRHDRSTLYIEDFLEWGRISGAFDDKSSGSASPSGNPSSASSAPPAAIPEQESGW